MLPPTGDDKDRGPAVMAIAWVECTFAIVVVSLRFWGRYLIKKVGIEDWLMLFTLLLFVLWCCLVTYYAALGGFRHLSFLLTSGADATRITFFFYLVQFFTTFYYAPAKTSIAITVLRIVPKPPATHRNWRKWLIIVTISLIWTATLINCILLYAQCDPPAGLWDPAVEHTCWTPGINPYFAYITTTLNVCADAVLAFVPASLVYNLNLELRKRATLCILLGLGILAGVCGIVKEVYVATLSGHADITWDVYSLTNWAGSELFVILFCGSVPALKPIWDKTIRRQIYSPRRVHIESAGQTQPSSNRKNVSKGIRFDSLLYHSETTKRGSMNKTDDNIEPPLATNTEVIHSNEWSAV